jgi:hypothetical protein
MSVSIRLHNNTHVFISTLNHLFGRDYVTEPYIIVCLHNCKIACDSLLIIYDINHCPKHTRKITFLIFKFRYKLKGR